MLNSINKNCLVHNLALVSFRYEKKHIKLPLSVEECKHLGEVLDKYKAKYYVNVLSGFVIVYVL